MSALDKPHDARVRRENIGALLLLLARCVHRAKQQNREGWTIAEDLVKMRDLLADLEVLDSQRTE